MSTDREKQTGANTAGQSELIEPLEAALLCVKCKIPMKTGKALLNNLSGIPDFIGDTHCCTVSPDGTARLIDCLKCPECGQKLRDIRVEHDMSQREMARLVGCRLGALSAVEAGREPATPEMVEAYQRLQQE